MSVKSYGTEFIGTFFLVLTVGLVIKGGKTDELFVLAPMAIGSVLMVMVCTGGHVSGGHYNPAVMLAVWLRGKLPSREVVPYWVSQLVGAFVASLCVYYVLGKTFARESAPNVGAVRAVLVEFLFTFALALVVLNAATAEATAGNSFYGLAIGFTVLSGAVAGGGVSGGAFDPAVGTGPLIARALIGGGSLAPLWIYWVGPLAGGAVAARPPRPDRSAFIAGRLDQSNHPRKPTNTRVPLDIPEWADATVSRRRRCAPAGPRRPYFLRRPPSARRLHTWRES